MQKYPKVINVLILLTLSILAFKQDELPDILTQKLNIFNSEVVQPNLYLHLDKNIYAPNESIWFKAYLLAGNAFNNEVLFVRLIDKDHNIVLQQKYPMYDIRSEGDLLLPADIEPGSYQLCAYTDKMINFDGHWTFTEHVEIVRNTGGRLNTRLIIADSSSLQPGKNVDIVCNVFRSGVAVNNTKIKYTLTTPDNFVYKEDKAVTNAAGVSIIHFTYPKIDDNEQLQLKIQFIKDNTTQMAELKLPTAENKINIEASAEGGRLIAGVSNRVVFQSTGSSGAAEPVRIQLKDQKRTCAIFKTDAAGSYTLNFVPAADEKYTLEVTNSTGRKQLMDLPLTAEPKGWGMRLEDNGKGQFVRLFNQAMPSKATLVVRSATDVVWHAMVNIKSGDSLLIKLPLADSAKKIYSAAVFDSEDKFYSERLFVNRHEDNFKVNISFEKLEYSKRQRVKADIIVTDASGKPVEANLSAGVVSAASLDMDKYQTILQAANKQFNDFNPPKENNLHLLNDYLISKHWYAGNWGTILSFQPTGKIRLLHNTGGLFGRVITKRPKPIKDTLYVLRKEGFVPVPVDADGTFSIPARFITGNYGENYYLILKSDFFDKHDIELFDFSQSFDAKVKAFNLMPYNQADFVESRFAQKLNNSLTGPHILKEVAIKGSKDFGSTEFYSKTCADWVCFYNVLDCVNHPSGRLPVEGEKVMYRGATVTYHGCRGGIIAESKTRIRLYGILLPRPFFLPDYEKHPVNEDELQSTIYWNPNLNTDSTGHVSFEFFTDDLKGDFKAIVQGITLKGIKSMYGEGGFKVQ